MTFLAIGSRWEYILLLNVNELETYIKIIKNKQSLWLFIVYLSGSTYRSYQIIALTVHG